MQLLHFIKTPLLVLLLLSCNKEKPEAPVNLKLKDKPLNEIKTAIQGKWQLHYSYGGITGRIRQNRTNSFIEFKPNDSIYWNNNNDLIVRDIITWNRRNDIIGDRTYIMSFCEMRGTICYPYSWGVEQIKNDTLILYDDATDAMGHYLTRK